MVRNISHGDIADNCSVHGIISTGFLPRIYGLSLDRTRYQTDPGVAHPTEQEASPHCTQGPEREGKTKEPFQIKRHWRHLTTKCNTGP